MTADAVQALQDFITRIDRLDPDAPIVATLPLGPHDIPLRRPVVTALVEALKSYHDPRDHGTCAHCQTGLLDQDLVCRSCGIVHGVFGQMLADRLRTTQPENDDEPRSLGWSDRGSR